MPKILLVKDNELNRKRRLAVTTIRHERLTGAIYT
jgi:hypothetical protein